MKKIKYCFLGLLAAFSFGLYSCQNDDVSNADLTEGSEEVFTVTEAIFTKGSTEIEGLGTYKTGETVTLKAAGGATITGIRTRGSGSFGETYQENGYAWAKIYDIHGDWTVSATLPDPEEYTVTVEAGTGGTASGGGKVTEGSSCNISASENEGYTFNGWTVTSGTATIGNSNNKSTTVTPSSDCTVTANFKTQAASKYTVTCSMEYSGSGESPAYRCTLNGDDEGNLRWPDKTSKTYINVTSGSKVNCGINSGGQGTFEGWYVNGEYKSSAIDIEVTITSHTTIVAKWQ